MFPKKLKKLNNNIYVDTKNLSQEEIIENSHKKLRRNGIVVINEFFKENIMSSFEQEYKDYYAELDSDNSIQKNFDGKKGYNLSSILHISNKLTQLWLNETILKIIEKYNKGLPIARNYPKLMKAKYTEDNISNFADSWHVDHSTVILVAVYLKDFTINDSHMQVILGSNTYPNVDNTGSLSSEYIEKNNLTIGDCYGKMGSVQIHCGNVYHRLKPVLNTQRSWIGFEFCAGNNILLDSQKIGSMLKNGFDLSSLNDRPRKILSGIFPMTLAKGHELKNGILRPNRFKGI